MPLIWLPAVFVAAWAFALGALAVTRTRERLLRGVDALHVVVMAANVEASARGHDSMTHVHLALALTFDPEIARRIDRIAPVDDLRDRIDAFLGERIDDDSRPVVSVPDPNDEVLAEYTRSLRGQEIRRSPAEYLTVLIGVIDANPSASPDVHALFDAFGLTAAAWRASASAPAADERPRAGLPYRSQGAPFGDHAVRFWNDDKSTQELVVGLLTSTFGRSPPEARYIMVRTHLMGSAAFGRFAQEAAERSVAAASEIACEAGYPLRITVERAGLAEPRGLWSRVFGK